MGLLAIIFLAPLIWGFGSAFVLLICGIIGALFGVDPSDD